MRPWFEVWSLYLYGVDPSVTTNLGPFGLACENFCETLKIRVGNRYSEGTAVSVLGDAHIGFNMWPDTKFVHILLTSHHSPGLFKIDLERAINKHFRPSHSALTILRNS